MKQINENESTNCCCCYFSRLCFVIVVVIFLNNFCIYFSCERARNVVTAAVAVAPKGILMTNFVWTDSYNHLTHARARKRYNNTIPSKSIATFFDYKFNAFFISYFASFFFLISIEIQMFRQENFILINVRETYNAYCKTEKKQQNLPNTHTHTCRSLKNSETHETKKLHNHSNSIRRGKNTKFQFKLICCNSREKKN